MPYIPLEDRDRLNGDLERLADRINTPGELAYVLFTLTISQAYKGGGVSYAKLAEVDGVLGTTHHEFRRRFVAPYETTKRHENGDVR